MKNFILLMKATGTVTLITAIIVFLGWVTVNYPWVITILLLAVVFVCATLICYHIYKNGDKPIW